MPKPSYASVADVLLTAWAAHSAARTIDGVETAADASAQLDVAAFEAVRLAFSHPDAPKFFAALESARSKLAAIGSGDEEGDEEGDAASPADEQLTDASEDEEVALDVGIGDPVTPPLAPTQSTENPAPPAESDSDEKVEPAPAVDEGAMLPETAFSSLTLTRGDSGRDGRTAVARRVAVLRARA